MCFWTSRRTIGIWAEWSVNRLDAAAIRGPLLINAVVYAEFSVGFVRVEEVDRVLDGAGFEMVDIPRAALFLAGKVFQPLSRPGR
jgi:hypothetical protein